MARLPATRKELKASFKKHFSVYRAYKDTTFPVTAKRLLLFYSVESGLKCFLLEQSHERSTDKLGKDYGHNIRLLAKDAKISSENRYRLHSFALPNGTPVNPELLHQVWRYAIETNRHDAEQKNEEALFHIAQWLEENLSR